MNGETVISTKGLTKRFGTKTVVDDVDLEVKRGEIVGFLGPNGSGKTTTIRMICGLLRPDAGEGTALGLDIRTQADLIKREVGYMTQRFSFYEDLTIRENLEFVARLYRLPDRRKTVDDTLDRLGLENLDAIESDLSSWGADAEFERVGALAVAVEPHEVEWLHELAAEARARGDESVRLLDQHETRAAVASPTYLGSVWETRTNALVHPGKLASELARIAEELGVEIFEHSPVRRVDTPGSTGAVAVETDQGRVLARHAVLATNVFPALLKRNRLMTVPVYDYVLMTEPLTAEQLASIGWHGRQGISDMANQFHYYRMTRDGRILFGGYDAVYHYGGRVRASYEDRRASFEKLAAHFFTTFPQLEGVRFSHRWAGAIDTSTRFCAFFGTARDDRVAYASGFTGLGVAATRFAGEVMLDLLEHRENERTSLRMVRERPLPFPPEPAASIGINATRWSLDRADHERGRRNLLLKTLDALGLGFDS